LLTTGGSVLSIDGLWGLAVGNDVSAGSSQNIYFSAGPGGESHGLFGALTPGVPEPTTWTLMLLGLGAIGAGMRRAPRNAPRNAQSRAAPA
jgi:hypothetical protein